MSRRLKTAAIVSGICLASAGIALGSVQESDPKVTQSVSQNNSYVPEYLTQSQVESGLIGYAESTQVVVESDEKVTEK